MTIFSSPGASPAGKRILAAGKAFAARKAKAVADADRAIAEAVERRIAIETERQRVATEEWMAREAQACAEQHYDDPVTQPRPTMAQIVAGVSERTGISVKDIMSARRTKRFIPARQESYWLCREWTMHSYPTIARFFRRDHTTVLAGCRAHEKRMVREVPFDG